MDILTKILKAKRERLAEAKAAVSLERLRDEVPKTKRSGRFREAISRTDRINAIAEIKRASPSKGIIRTDFDPAKIAREYTEGGAAALSVLTEEDFFQGSLEILRLVRRSTDLPLLRKDFIFDEYQVYEAAWAGADAFLLIAAALEADEISELSALGTELGLDALIEVHTAQELEKVLNCKPSIIGVNNRCLKTFEVDLNVSIELAARAPADAALVSESGINRAEDIVRLHNAGYRAFLIGEQLMRAESPGAALKELLRI